jgi:hypothetical protein
LEERACSWQQFRDQEKFTYKVYLFPVWQTESYNTLQELVVHQKVRVPFLEDWEDYLMAIIKSRMP